MPPSQRSVEELEKQEVKERLRRLYTLSAKEMVVIAVVVIGWAFMLDQHGDVNLAQPIVELEQGK